MTIELPQLARLHAWAGWSKKIGGKRGFPLPPPVCLSTAIALCEASNHGRSN